jgi:hypothetical protein
VVTASVSPPREAVRPAPRPWAGYIGFAWALSYIPIHVYWALGGLTPAIGITTGGPNFRAANWGACLVILGAGLVGLSLVRPWGEVLPRAVRHGAAWVGAVFGILHALAFCTVSALRLASVIAYPESADFTSRQMHAYDWSNLLYFEPWFGIMGVLLILTSRYARRHGAAGRREPVAWMRRATWARPASITALGLGIALHLLWAFGVLVPARTGDVVPRLVSYGVFDVAAAILLTALAVAIARRRSTAWRRGGTALTLAGLLTVVWGVFTFDPWTFAAYGPALMAAGLLALLAHIASGSSRSVRRAGRPAQAG